MDFKHIHSFDYDFKGMKMKDDTEGWTRKLGESSVFRRKQELLDNTAGSVKKTQKTKNSNNWALTVPIMKNYMPAWIYNTPPHIFPTKDDKRD